MTSSTISNYRDLFFPCHKPQLAKRIETHSRFCSDVAKVIADYLTAHQDCFGVNEWKKYYGVEPIVVDAEQRVSSNLLPELSFEPFYQFWHGPDPFDKKKQRSETYHLPRLRPQHIRIISNQKIGHYHLSQLNYMMEHPLIGQKIGLFYDDNEPTRLLCTTPSEPAAWIVMRKEVVARGLSFFNQLFARLYHFKMTELEVSAIDVSTVLATEYITTGQRYLGHDTGVEQRRTLARCKEKVTLTLDEDHQTVEQEVVVGKFSEKGFLVSSIDAEDDNMYKFGLIHIKKFPA